MKKILLAALGAALIPVSSVADHAWSTYHWARTTASFDLAELIHTTLVTTSAVMQTRRQLARSALGWSFGTDNSPRKTRSHS